MSQDYTPQQVAELVARGGVQVIDVRTAAEHDAGHIAGTRWIELSELPGQADSIDPATPLIFYCGSRSALATEAFVQAGYDAHNMTGGMVAWDAANLRLEPPDGRIV
jgi:rhodanese-related sulfurtransferase